MQNSEMVPDSSTPIATSYKKTIDLCFYRAGEPISVTKGANRQHAFSVSDKFYADRYKKIGPIIARSSMRDANEVIDIQDIEELPDLSVPLQVDRMDMFSVYIPKHRDAAVHLTNIFLNCKNTVELQSYAVYIRDRVNPFMYNWSLSMALINRTDTRDFHLPSCLEVFPEKYIDSIQYQRAREEATVVPQADRIPVPIPAQFTASNVDDEQRTAYFREDIGINMNYWRFQLAYPTDGRPVCVDKDRRGELFYFLHQQILARYNCERLSNKLHRVERLHSFRNVIEEAYFPKLNTELSSRNWPARFANSTLSDLSRSKEHLYCDLADLERWVDRIYESVELGQVIHCDGRKIPINNDNGINILGNIIQSTILSPNRKYYGNLCNMAHLFIAYCHDPNGRHLESYGVMGECTTTMRDPVFYRLYAFINHIFQRHKACLPPYSVEQLKYDGIAVSHVEVQFQNKANQQRNIIHTYWEEKDFNLSRGLDYTPRGNLFIRKTQLNREDFTIKIKIKNSGELPRQATVRIFMAPKMNERGEVMSFNEIRHFMIQLDMFATVVKPGSNSIYRRSGLSSVTIPFERMFFTEKATVTKDKDDYSQICTCGWPENMIVPKGYADGMNYVLFVHITNYNDDKIEQEKIGQCQEAPVYCGIPTRKYPDSRCMGFPFDRPVSNATQMLPDFLLSNMYCQEVLVKFTTRTTAVATPAPPVLAPAVAPAPAAAPKAPVPNPIPTSKNAPK